MDQMLKPLWLLGALPLTPAGALTTRTIHPRAATRVTSLYDVQWSANAQKTPVLVPDTIKKRENSTWVVIPLLV